MPDNPQSWPLSGVNLATTIIQCYLDDANVASASGFFFRHCGRKYLVTNRHVVIDEENEYRPDQLKIRLHSDLSDPQRNFTVFIPLYSSGGKAAWLEHSQGTELGCDVVLVPLPEARITRAHMNFVTIDNIPGKDINIPPFSDVVVIGYPLGFYDEANNLPIYRQGMLASPFPFGFENKPCFLIDANLHSGTSGSMVLNSPHNVLNKRDTGAAFHTQKVLLLGVFSDEYVVEGDPLNLNTVWHSYLLVQIAEEVDVKKAA